MGELVSELQISVLGFEAVVVSAGGMVEGGGLVGFSFSCLGDECCELGRGQLVKIRIACSKQTNKGRKAVNQFPSPSIYLSIHPSISTLTRLLPKLSSQCIYVRPFPSLPFPSCHITLVV